MARTPPMKQSGPPEQLLGTLPDPKSQHMPQRAPAIPPQFTQTMKAMTDEGQDAETAGADGQPPQGAVPGAPGTGLQGLPPGVRDVIASADKSHWHVP